MINKLKLLLVLFISLIFILSCSGEDSNSDSCGVISEVNYSVTSTSVSITFLKGSKANSTKIEYGPTGFTQGTGSIFTTSENYFAIDNLIPSTTYDFYLTSICSATEQSNTFALNSITTGQNACTGTASAIIYQIYDVYGITVDLDYNNSTPDYYEVEYGVAGFTLGNGTRLNTNSQLTTDNLEIYNIQPNTNYDIYVRAVCHESAPNDASNFIKYTYRTVGSCPKPTNLNSYLVSGSCNNLTAKYAVSWSNDFGAANYTVVVVPQGGNPDEAEQYTVSNNGATFSGMGCMWKAFYVRSNCENGDHSSWAGPHYF